MSKKVSVIIPTYRRPLFLKRAIESVLNSTYKDIELIVVDDNNDGDAYRQETERLMQEMLKIDQRVRYLKHNVNKNGSAARNTGIRNSTGEYIMFLDDDDVFLPEKIEKQVEFMENHDDEWGASYTQYLDVYQNGKIRKGLERASGNMLVNELARNFFVHAGSNLMVRRKVVEAVGGFDESFQKNQDIEFLVKILRTHKIGYVDCVGLKVYLHPRTIDDYNEITEQFIRTFSVDIGALSENEKRKVYTMLGLQLIRYNVGKKKMKEAFEIKKRYAVKLKYVVSYFFHLAKRQMTNAAYGYPIDKIA